MPCTGTHRGNKGQQQAQQQHRHEAAPAVAATYIKNMRRISMVWRVFAA